MANKSIIFMGTPEFAVTSLRKLIDDGHRVVGVVTAPDRPAGRGRKLRGSAVKEAALELDIPVLQPVKLKDPEFHRQMHELNADLFVVVAFRMLPEVVWTMPKNGTINLHGSLLPKYRGAAPINWAVMNGETATGVTTFFITHQIDTGDIIAQRKIPIGTDMTAGELHDEMKHTGAELLSETVRAIFSDEGAPREPQQALDEDDPARHAPKIFTEDCRINWDRSAKKVHDHIRGLSPYPGAWIMLVDEQGNATKFKVLRSQRTEDVADKDPGAIHVKDDEELFVACNDQWLQLTHVQAAGKRRMTAAELLRGSRDLDQHHFE